MATLFGVTGAGLAGYKMHKRTEGLKEFEFEPVLLVENQSDDNNINNTSIGGNNNSNYSSTTTSTYDDSNDNSNSDNDDRLGVIILISGYITTPGDHRRIYGLQPSQEDKF